MKILFICGALEPGRDGVGDYARRLAGAVRLLGHQSSIVALYDPYITAETTVEQPSDGGPINVLRIPRQADHRYRYRLLQQWTANFGPTWISLQFVPYAFNPKGLPFRLAGELQKLLTNKRQLHIMFHESWVGTEGRIRLNRWITGKLQQHIIKNMIQVLKPAIMHTQLPATQQNLRAMASGVKPLPLFSNIEVAGAPVQPVQNMRIGFFSQAAASAPVVSFLKELSANVVAAGIIPELLLIGGDPVQMKIAGDSLEKITAFTNRVYYTGFLAPAEISAALQSCALGITLVPRHALGKSGSVAAFLQHGIPVAAPVIQEDIDPLNIGFFSSNLCAAILLTPDTSQLAVASKAAAMAKSEISLPVIATLFVENICPENHAN